MTKYIIHGGETSRKTDDNKKFFFEMTKDNSNPVKILCIYFAREEESWDKLFEQDKVCFSSASPTKVLQFTRAERNAKIFTQQVIDSDVIYMRGGTTNDLLNQLKEYENFASLISGKIVSGSSAGACVLASHFYTGTKGSLVREGLGILPIKTFVHYAEEKHKNELKDLDETGEKLEIIKIPEEKFFVINR